MFEKVDLQVELPRVHGTPQLARWVLRSWCTGRLGANLLADAQLTVTELTTNALSHGQGHITLRVYLDEDHLFVQVIDQGATSSASYAAATGLRADRQTHTRPRPRHLQHVGHARSDHRRLV